MNSKGHYPDDNLFSLSNMLRVLGNQWFGKNNPSEYCLWVFLIDSVYAGFDLWWNQMGGVSTIFSTKPEGVI